MTTTPSDLSNPSSAVFSYDVLTDIYTNAENPLLSEKGVPAVLRDLLTLGLRVVLKTHDGTKTYRLTSIDEKSFTVEKVQTGA